MVDNVKEHCFFSNWPYVLALFSPLTPGIVARDRLICFMFYRSHGVSGENGLYDR